MYLSNAENKFHPLNGRRATPLFWRDLYLTFAFMIQIAIALGLIWCTADIKATYLNVPRPAGEIPILTKLERFVAEICGLDPDQLYRIDKCLYGLPDSGRHLLRRTDRRGIRH